MTFCKTFRKTKKPAAVRGGYHEIKFFFFQLYLLDRVPELYRLTSYIKVFSHILLQLHIQQSFEKPRIHSCQQFGKNSIYTSVLLRSFSQETIDNQQNGRNMAAQFDINLLFKWDSQLQQSMQSTLSVGGQLLRV